LTEKELNKNILNQLNVIKRNDNSELIHFKSTSNFIEHLLNDDIDVETIKKSNFGNLGRIRKKELLLKYLVTIEKEIEITDKRSDELFQQYIIPIGNFMSTYYGFSYIGGRAFLLKIILILSLSISADFIIYYTTDKFMFITILISILSATRYGMKFKQRKIYGDRY
jgi:hypothetical protein